MSIDWEWVRALIGLVWILGCWSLAVYCLVIGQLGLFFGLAVASLALPIAFTAFEGDADA